MAKKKDKHKQHPNHSQKGKEVNWDLVWKVLASIFAFAGSVATVYDLVGKVRSDAQTFYSFILPGLIIIIWVIVLAQLFRKKNPYAFLLLAVTLLGGVAGGIGWRSYNKVQEDKVIVLVAQFDGPEETYGLHNQIMEDLRQATKGYDDTEIIDGKEVVTAGQGSEYARELGNKVKADLVIWAWYRPTENPNVTIHFENLSTAQIETIPESETYQPEVTLTELENFEIQRKLGSETSTLVNFLTGVVRLKAGDYQSASDRFQKILLANDQSTLIDYYDLYFYLGYSFNALGSYEKSIQAYDQAIQYNPNRAGLYNNRGNDYSALGQNERAIEDFNKAIQIDAQFIPAYNNRGLAYEALKEYDLAIKDYDETIQLNPQYANGFLNRGNALSEKGQYERAIQNYGQSILIDPKNPKAYYNRGLSFSMLGEYSQAIEDFSQAIKLNSQYALAYNNRGNVYYSLKQYNRAIGDYDIAIKIDPRLPGVYSNRGGVYAALGKFDRAIQDYNQAIQIDSQFAMAYYNRGLSYQSLGKIAKAEADFKKYEELTGQRP